MKIYNIIRALIMFEEDQGNRTILSINIAENEIEVSFEDIDGELMYCVLTNCVEEEERNIMLRYCPECGQALEV